MRETGVVAASHVPDLVSVRTRSRAYIAEARQHLAMYPEKINPRVRRQAQRGAIPGRVRLTSVRGLSSSTVASAQCARRATR